MIDPLRPAGLSLAGTFRWATRTLAAAGVPSPEVDARILLLAASGLDRVALIRDPDLPVPPEAVERLSAWLDRRASREPVARILGSRDFWGLTLAVTPDVLDPRPDTETLVEAVLVGLDGRHGEPLTLVDLGTGSGAILCALLTELPQAAGYAVDRSDGACSVAQRNLAAHGLALRSLVLRGDWASALPGGAFDVLVSNPPYIETSVIADLDRDVRDHDPLGALDGGADGLDAYRVIVTDVPRLLVPGGIAAVEVGQGQDRDVMDLMAAAGLADITTRRDLSGIARVVLGRLR
ncbi:MAG: peptide chain release factor N(5)-glutamine methyltransferase [Janthinobacterium lividum]